MRLNRVGPMGEQHPGFRGGGLQQCAPVGRRQDVPQPGPANDGVGVADHGFGRAHDPTAMVCHHWARPAGCRYPTSKPSAKGSQKTA